MHPSFSVMCLLMYVTIILFYYLDLYVVLAHSFYPSIIALWNDLPHSVTSSSSLYFFKHNINQHLSAAIVSCYQFYLINYLCIAIGAHTCISLLCYFM